EDVHAARPLRLLLRAASADEGHGRGPLGSSPGEWRTDMDRMNRRGFLECAAWTGAAVVWTMTGGVASSRLASPASAAETDAGTFSFVQISDTHVGLKGQANPDAAVTLQQVIDRGNALPSRPAFGLHTRHPTHGQKAGAFHT